MTATVERYRSGTERVARSIAEDHRPILEYLARSTVDDLVRQGMPRPACRDLVIDGDDVALSLTLASVDQLRAWAAVVDTTDLEPTGPHRIGPVSTITITGRLVGIPTVLHAEVPHDHPTDLERAEARALAEVRALLERDGPPTADHDTAGWRAAIDAAVRETPTEQP